MESCLKKLSFCLKTAIFGGGNMVVLPLQDPQGFPGMAHLGPKSYPQVSTENGIVRYDMTGWNGIVWYDMCNEVSILFRLKKSYFSFIVLE